MWEFPDSSYIQIFWILFCMTSLHVRFIPPSCLAYGDEACPKYGYVNELMQRLIFIYFVVIFFCYRSPNFCSAFPEAPKTNFYVYQWFLYSLSNSNNNHLILGFLKYFVIYSKGARCNPFAHLWLLCRRLLRFCILWDDWLFVIICQSFCSANLTDEIMGRSWCICQILMILLCKRKNHHINTPIIMNAPW